MSTQNSSSFLRLMELCHTHEGMPPGPARAEMEMNILQTARMLTHEYMDTTGPTPIFEMPPAEVISLDLRRAKFNLEKNLIQQALTETGGNKSRAARLLGITREGLRKAMKKAV